MNGNDHIGDAAHRGPRECVCGCGAATSSERVLYRPGHDARHASQVARAIKDDPDRRTDLLSTLPSAALKAKAEAMASPARPPIPTETAAPGPVQVAGEHVLPVVAAGDSSVQQEAEAVLLNALAARLNVSLTPERITLSDGSWVEVDGVSHHPPVLAEAWAHQGPPKAAQRNKVLADALKLVHIAAALGGVHRKILCFSNDAAAAPFTGRSWYAGALRALQVECHVVSLDDRWRQRIMEAQRRQFR